MTRAPAPSVAMPRTLILSTPTMLFANLLMCTPPSYGLMIRNHKSYRAGGVPPAISSEFRPRIVPKSAKIIGYRVAGDSQRPYIFHLTRW